MLDDDLEKIINRIESLETFLLVQIDGIKFQLDEILHQLGRPRVNFEIFEESDTLIKARRKHDLK